jgi:hypothetical protein
LQLPTAHIPLEQAPVPFATLQTFPQVPQFSGSDWSIVEHEFPPEQSQKFVAHIPTPHIPATQFGVPFIVEQTFPQPLQLLTSEASVTSQPFVSLPSQLAKPGVQTMPHWDAVHVALPFWLLQAAPQAPQFAGSAERSVSQPLAGLPSQSAKGALQLPTAQVPFEHAGTACGRLHAVLQLPQWSGSF